MLAILTPIPFASRAGSYPVDAGLRNWPPSSP
jgi:hypothetical protein